MIKAVRGTRDLLPPETALFQFVEDRAREIFALYNFHEIRTPILEDAQLFARSVGEETDIVSKEMFTWEDKARAQSEKSQQLCLRPENTAGVVRAYIEHKLFDTGTLQKLYYIGPQFRRERPQKGRHRQFYQIGAEAIGPPSSGSESPVRDAEIIEMLATLLGAAGLADWELKINSVGCAVCRPVYLAKLREALSQAAGTLCADCQRRAVSNPLRVLDCKVPEDQATINGLPTIADSLDEGCRAHFAEVRAILDGSQIRYKVDPRMVRGLDYYTRTTFEFTHGDLGAQNALLGGGRYDGLSEALDGPPAPGIGFALGLDRFVLALQAAAPTPGNPPHPGLTAPSVYVAPLGPGMNVDAIALARQLRAQGLSVEVGDESFRLKKSLEAADRLGATFVAIMGANEAQQKDSALIKDLRNGEQFTIPRDQVAAKIKERRST